MSALHASLYSPMGYLGDYTESVGYQPPSLKSKPLEKVSVKSKSPAKVQYTSSTNQQPTNPIIQKYSSNGQNYLKGNQIQNFLKDLMSDLKLIQSQLQTAHTPYANLVEIPKETTLTAQDLQNISQKYFSFQAPTLQRQQSTENIPKEHKVRAKYNSTYQKAQPQSNYCNNTMASSSYRRVENSPTRYSSPRQQQQYESTTLNNSYQYKRITPQQYSDTSNNNYTSSQQSSIPSSQYRQQYTQPSSNYTTTTYQQQSQPQSMNNSIVRQQTLPIGYQNQPQTSQNNNSKMMLQKLSSNIFNEKFKVNNKNKKPESKVMTKENLFSYMASGMSKEKQKKRQQQYKTKDPSQVGYKPGVKIQSAIAQAQASGRKYTDPEFPPNMNSISNTGYWYDDEEVPGKDWIRPENYFKQGYELFEQGIIPGDIKQAGLGDCYFQCTLAALAEWPERIQRIFSSPYKSQWGVYSVWVVWNGVWQEVVVDDNLWFDSNYNSFVSMQSNGNEIWPQIIEKAWAKLHGNFLRIDGGFARDPLHDFTGAPVMHFRIKENQNWNQLRDILFNQLLQGEANDFIMCAGTYGENEEEEELGDDQQRDGIFYGHAYSILAAYQLNIGGTNYKLIKFRNPHGEGEYTGRFSDSDPIWNRVSQSDKQRLDYTEKDDGIFFLEYDKLRTYFEDVQICSYRNNYIYEGIKVNTHMGEQESYFKVTIPQSSQNGYYYFQLNQVARAQFDDDDYTYQNGAINVVDQAGKWVVSVSGRQKNISSYKYQQNPKPLAPGTYYVMTKLKIGSAQQRLGISSYGFGVYGQQKVQIQGPLPVDQIGQYVSLLKQSPYGVSETIQSFVI